MRTLIFAIFMLAFCVSSFAAPKKQANKKTKLSVNNIVNVCGEPSAGYNMQGVLGFADFMLFTHDKCPKIFGAAAVVYRGDAVKPAIKIAEAIVGLYIMTTYPSGDIVEKKVSVEPVMMGQPPHSYKFTVVIFEFHKKKVRDK